MTAAELDKTVQILIDLKKAGISAPSGPSLTNR